MLKMERAKLSKFVRTSIGKLNCASQHSPSKEGKPGHWACPWHIPCCTRSLLFGEGPETGKERNCISSVQSTVHSAAEARWAGICCRMLWVSSCKKYCPETKRAPFVFILYSDQQNQDIVYGLLMSANPKMMPWEFACKCVHWPKVGLWFCIQPRNLKQ